MRRLAMMLALMSTLGCTSSQPATDGSASPPPSDDAKGPDPSVSATPSPGTRKEPGPPSGNTDKLTRLVGVGEAALLAEFGEPSSTRSFTMGDCCNEFEIELYNTYPPGKGHDAVEIHEYTWAYDGYLLTVWLHDPGKGWEVLNTLLYGDTVEF
ncbi:MAG: hypothetical protein KC501_31330 [Myxococcales bacterium]|nr:hypothetical protein [Myxococcales bacterium]